MKKAEVAYSKFQCVRLKASRMHRLTIKYIRATPIDDSVGDVNLELLVGQLLAGIGYVAAAVRWLHLAHCDCAVVGGASNEEGLALRCLTGGHSVGWNVASLDGQPLAAAGAKDFVLVVAVLTAAPGNVGDAM